MPRALLLSSLLCLAMSVKVDILSAHPGNAKVTTAHAYDSRECAPPRLPAAAAAGSSSRAASRGDLETLSGGPAGIRWGSGPHNAKPHTLPSTQR